MKTAIILTTLFILQPAPQYEKAVAVTFTYHLIEKTKEIPGSIDTSEINRLSEPLKALAALYSSIGGSMCDGEHCELTDALGLGKQGSPEHKAIIKKYFPDDKIAALVLKQDCYLRPSGASTFSDFQYLTIIQKGNVVKVQYSLFFYVYGKTNSQKGTDTYLLEHNIFKKIKRNIWKEADK